jgi:Protein of unknown function (DUF2939)
MRRTVRIGGGILLVACLTYLAGPLWAGWQLRQAMRTRDVAAMEGRVDWPQLRANLKPRITTAINDSADASGTIGGALKRALGSVLSNTAVDTLVTPSNLSRLLAGRAFMLDRRGSTDSKAPQPVDDHAEDPDDPVPPKRVRWAFFESPTRFRVEATNPKLPNSRIVSILALQGLSWKLVDIDIVKQ